MKSVFTMIVFGISVQVLFAQFAPQAGLSGTTAIHKDSSVFVNWAIGGTITRGWKDISDKSLGLAEVGDESYIPGMAGNGIVSLGDGGQAVVTFNKPIKNGPGFDFAVFENGFIDQTLKPGTAFLELAFVEVSSDGINFFRFPAISNNDTTIQLESFDGIDASKINNLAGKYIVNYGTPFDLSDLANVNGLDVNQITHVRIIDVVGSINESFATKDSRGAKINDPWPTPFAQSGFDLDAIGVIHQRDDVGTTEIRSEQIVVYPNPLQRNGEIHITTGHNTSLDVKLINLIGEELMHERTENGWSNLPDVPSGVYYLHISTDNGIVYKKVVVQ